MNWLNLIYTQMCKDCYSLAMKAKSKTNASDVYKAVQKSRYKDVCIICRLCKRCKTKSLVLGIYSCVAVIGVSSLCPWL